MVNSPKISTFLPKLKGMDAKLSEIMPPDIPEDDIGDILRKTYASALLPSVGPSVITLMLELSHLPNEVDRTAKAPMAAVSRDSTLRALITKLTQRTSRYRGSED